MGNMRILLFGIHILEWTERHSIRSAPRGRMNKMLRMKIQDGGRRDISDADSNAPLQDLPEKKKKQETLLDTMKLCFFFPCTKVRGVFH